MVAPGRAARLVRRRRVGAECVERKLLAHAHKIGQHVSVADARRRVVQTARPVLRFAALLDVPIRRRERPLVDEAAARLAADNTLSGRLDTTEATLGDRTATQLSYLDATSSVQTQIDTRITESAVALLIASEADNLQTQLNDINTRLTNAGY